MSSIKSAMMLTGLLVLSACNKTPVQEESLTDSRASVLASMECLKVAGAPESVLLADLVRSPEEYDGKKVKVEGYYYSRFEHEGFYPTPRDPLTARHSEGLWLTNMPAGDSALLDRNISIVGVVSALEKGHSGQFAATLCVLKAVSNVNTNGESG